MKRDFVCLLRQIADSLPTRARNSRVLFEATKLIFNAPEDLFAFRDKYDRNEISDLSKYYIDDAGKNRTIRLSRETDINSKHLKEIIEFVASSDLESVLDVGCGSGYLLNKIVEIKKGIKATGIDFGGCHENPKSNYEHITGNIEHQISKIDDKSYDCVICTHVLEHVEKPEDLLIELRRTARQSVIVICPIEKKFKWGLNYHVNFFETIDDFCKFLNKKQTRNKNASRSRIIPSIGDALCIEIFD